MLRCFRTNFIARPPVVGWVSLLRWLIDLVENPAIREMNALGFVPVAYNLREREKFYLGKCGSIFLGNGVQARPVEIPSRDFLSLGRVEVFEIRLRDGPSAPLVDHAVHNRHRRL